MSAKPTLRVHASCEPEMIPTVILPMLSLANSAETSESTVSMPLTVRAGSAWQAALLGSSTEQVARATNALASRRRAAHLTRTLLVSEILIGIQAVRGEPAYSDLSSIRVVVRQRMLDPRVSHQEGESHSGGPGFARTAFHRGSHVVVTAHEYLTGAVLDHGVRSVTLEEMLQDLDRYRARGRVARVRIWYNGKRELSNRRRPWRWPSIWPSATGRQFAAF